MDFISGKGKYILFIGALWGISEASLGYLLHWLPMGFAGAIMFPIGAFFLYQAWQKDASYSSLALITAIAALVKSVDFLLPLPSPMSVLNPMTAILMQGIVLSAFLPLLEKKRSIIMGFAAAFSWIFLFTAFQAFVFRPIDGLWLSALLQMATVFAVITFFGGALLHFAISNESKSFLRFSRFSPSWLHSLLLFAFAIALEALNSLF